MKKTLTGFLLLTLFFSTYQKLFAQTFVSGEISVDTTWPLTGNPYIATGNILIDTGVTLTMDPGVILRFDGAYELEIDGTLNAQGDSTRQIIFTSNSSTPAPGDWNYIYIGDVCHDYNSALQTGCMMRYCTVEYAGGDASANWNAGVRAEKCTVLFDHCLIQHNLGGGLSIYDYDYTYTNITNSVIYDNQGNGIVYWGDGPISCNLIVKNQEGLFVGEGYTLVVTNNVFAENTGWIFGFGYWDYETFNNNSIVNDTCTSDLLSTSQGGLNFNYNTFAGNLLGGTSSIVSNSANHHYHHNNFFNNTATGNYYVFSNQNPVGNGNIDADSNYWGTTLTSE